MKFKARSVVLAAAGLALGVTSGVYWIRAALVPIHESDPPTPIPLPDGLPAPIAANPNQKSISMLGIQRYTGKSGDLNWKAAAWSIAGVIASSISSLLSAYGF